MRVRALELVDSFQSLVNPGVALPEPIARLTGLREQELRRRTVGLERRSAASSRSRATRCSSRTTPASTSAFSSGSCSGDGGACPSRRSARPRSPAACSRAACAASAWPRSPTSSAFRPEPCHRALPDAEATAQVLVHLIGLAQELGARTLSELRALAAPRKRRVYDKRSSPAARRAGRASTSSATDHDQVLYVGRARDLRARLRSYFRSDRQRPSVEAALLALGGSNGACSAPSSRLRSRSCA